MQGTLRRLRGGEIHAEIDEFRETKNWGCGSVSCPDSPVPQICVVASNVVDSSKVTRKVTEVQWPKVSRAAEKHVAKYSEPELR